MAYLHIPNLYKAQEILLFREVFALEKIHGTSAHIGYKPDRTPRLTLFAGGASHQQFIALFDAAALEAAFVANIGEVPATVYGEAYGGSCQKMKATYGDKLQFIVFDVQINDCWLSVPAGEDVAKKLSLPFVGYRRIECSVPTLDAERDAPSVQAERNGMGSQPREGIVIRPLTEMLRSDGKRIIAKHKNDAFAERGHPPRVVDDAKFEIERNAEAIATEWVTPMRLAHVLDKMPETHDITLTGAVIHAMAADIAREAAGEIELTKAAHTAIGRRTAMLFKQQCHATLFTGKETQDEEVRCK